MTMDNVTELQSLLSLAQTCRAFRQLLVESHATSANEPSSA
jgi:hypothetical protein